MENLPSKVFVSDTDEFGSYEAIKKAFRFLGVNLNFKNVAIKLNLCSLKPRESGAISDLIVVEQLVKLLNDNGVSVRLVESNSGSKDADLAFEYLGFKDLEKKYDVKCVNLSKESFSVKNLDGYYLKKVRIPKTLENTEFFISHPKLKTHSSMKVRVTGSLKNQFGCLTGNNKAIYHPFIHEVIADINTVFHPNLTIMDSIIAMTGYGPTDGNPQRLNLLFTSTDPVAVDALAARVFGYNPMDIRYLRLSSNKGLGNIDSLVLGNKIEPRKVEMGINNFIMRSFELLSTLGISAPE
jgi:uncharacterized protein (DUF362 family)